MSQQLKLRAPQSLCRRLVTILVLVLVSLLRCDLNHSFVTVKALRSPTHQRRIKDLLCPTYTSTFGTGTLQMGYTMPLQEYRRHNNMELHLMNWFGFGGNNNDGESTNDSNLSSDASSTVLLTASSKDSSGKSSLSGSKTGGSGVVTIMDSMDQLKRSQRIGKITATLVQELKSITVEGSSENGKIKIVFDGQQNPISTYIDESYFREQQQQRSNADPTNDLANAITAAMKDARMKSVEKMNEKMKNVYNDLGFYNASP